MPSTGLLSRDGSSTAISNSPSTLKINRNVNNLNHKFYSQQHLAKGGYNFPYGAILRGNAKGIATGRDGGGTNYDDLDNMHLSP